VDFGAVVDHVIALLRQRGRLTYSTLKRQFQLDDAALEDVKNELIEGQRLAVDERGNVLVWTGDARTAPPVASTSIEAPVPPPLTYTPPYLAEKILTSRSALEGERKQVTVLFADLKGSTELIRDLDPEAAQQLLDPALHIMLFLENLRRTLFIFNGLRSRYGQRALLEYHYPQSRILATTSSARRCIGSRS
jgi:hypothetical protein